MLLLFLGFVLFFASKGELSPSAPVTSNVWSEPLRCNKTSPETERPSNFGWGTKTGMISAAKQNNYRKPRKQKTGRKKKRDRKDSVCQDDFSIFCSFF